MKFKSFGNTASDDSVTYSYTKRGTDEFYFPDKLRERNDGLASYNRTCGNF